MAKITDDVKYPPVDAAAETDTYLTIRAGRLYKTALAKILAYLGITRAVDSLTIDRSVVIVSTISAGIPLSEAPATRAITAQEMRGGQLSNRGQLAELTNTLDPPAEGLNFIYCIETVGAGAVHFKADDNHAILMDDGSSQTMLGNGAKASIVIPALYNMLTGFARKNDAGAWYWHILAGTGTTITDGGV